MKMRWLSGACLVVAGLLLAQFIQPGPVQAHRSSTGRDLLTDSTLPPQVHAILDRSCVDCHSANGHLPWYGHISPVSWFVIHHVEKGRKKLDFSDWPRNDYDLRQNIADSVDDRSMPLHSYCCHRQVFDLPT
jgi:hypothetical protein